MFLLLTYSRLSMVVALFLNTINQQTGRDTSIIFMKSNVLLFSADIPSQLFIHSIIPSANPNSCISNLRNDEFQMSILRNPHLACYVCQAQHVPFSSKVLTQWNKIVLSIFFICCTSFWVGQ